MYIRFILFELSSYNNTTSMAGQFSIARLGGKRGWKKIGLVAL
jgi:hypothetical protein